jgi:hypothetical protein
MKLSDVLPVLDRVARNSNGSYRVLASRLLPGRVLGGFKYYGTRPDDPNDVIPHEHRRELRALKVFGAWTNLVDMKALNTMDTLVTEDGQARVRHYLLDVGSTFGIGANGPREWWEGYEYLFEQDKTLKRMASFGFYLQPWQTVDYTEYPSEGRFEGDEFNPDDWKTRVSAGALLRARADDDFWAARRVMAFSDELIRALVKTGRYSDPKAEEHLATVLIKRRNKIGQAYLTRLNPLVRFSLTPSDVLTFENAAVKTGMAKEPASYIATWSNSTTAPAPPGRSAKPRRRADERSVGCRPMSVVSFKPKSGPSGALCLLENLYGLLFAAWARLAAGWTRTWRRAGHAPLSGATEVTAAVRVLEVIMHCPHRFYLAVSNYSW